MRNKMIAGFLACALGMGLLVGCGGQEKPSEAAVQKDETKESDNPQSGEAKDGDNAQSTEIQVFIAASLNTVMTQLAEEFNKEHPEISIVFNADSSGTLMTQIMEGYECDIFFSAAQKQMNSLEE